MRMQWLPMIAIIIVNLCLDLAIWRWLGKRKNHARTKQWIHLGASLVMLALIVTAISLPNRTCSNSTLDAIMWMLFTYLSITISRAVTMLLWQVGRLCRGKWTTVAHSVASVLGIALFGTIWWGALVTPGKVDVERITVESEKIPKSFDGFRIVQISDLHTGTYGTDTSRVSLFADSIAALRPDVVLFTGDLVDRVASEAEPFLPVLRRIKAPHGVLSVLGNHDYSDYANWPSPEAKAADHAHLLRLQAKAGWMLLDNRTVPLAIGSDTIDVLGAGCFGDPPFHTYGSIATTGDQRHNGRFKIYLQHNPYEWRDEIVGREPIDLMLSGHTHAMQIMIKIAGHKYSPARWRYREWGGRYDAGWQSLYVNIGLGMVGIPMRIGATPEITLITLRAK